MADYSWSSLAGGYLLTERQRPKWFEAEMGLAACQCGDTAAGRRKLVRRLHERAIAEGMERCGIPATDAEVDARLSGLERGWYWGSREFAEKVVRLGEKIIQVRKKRGYRYSGEKRSHDLAEAERMILEVGKIEGLSEKDWRGLSGADPRKVALAHLLWSRTTVTQGWICEALGMSSAANVSQQIRRWKKEPQTKKLSAKLRGYLSK